MPTYTALSLYGLGKPKSKPIDPPQTLNASNKEAATIEAKAWFQSVRIAQSAFGGPVPTFMSVQEDGVEFDRLRP